MPDKEKKENKVTLKMEPASTRSTILPPSSMTWSGNLSDNWKFYKQKFILYLQATKSDNESSEFKSSILLSSIGDKALKVYNNFVFENEEDKMKLEKIIAKYDEYFLPEKNVTYERHVFFLRNQLDGESIDNYITELRDLSSSCEFGDLCDSLIKDRLVLGVNEVAVKERLLRVKDLTLAKAMDICRSAERTRQQMENLSGTENASLNDLHRISTSASTSQGFEQARKPPRRSQPQFQKSRFEYARRAPTRNQYEMSCEADKFVCKKCATRHGKNECPAYGIRCRRCKALNHFEKCCFSNFKQVNQVDNVEINSSDSDFYLDSIDFLTTSSVKRDYGLVSHSKFIHSLSNSNSTDDWSVKMFVENTIINFKVDSGAQVNVLPHSFLPKLHISKNHLYQTNAKLITYTHDEIPVLGKCYLNCRYKNRTAKVTFFIVGISNSLPILGKRDSEKFGIIKFIANLGIDNECQNTSIGKYDILVNKYRSVFGGIGSLNCPEYHISINKDVQPTIHAPRKVPLAIQSDLKHLLDKMVDKNIIKKVNKPSEWVNSLVLVRKPNGKLRVCIDPKDLNKAIKREYFPLPTLDEILSKLANSKYFSKVDASEAFWHIKLDKESSYLCTFNSPFGRYRFLRMPYGITPASEVFHKIIKQNFEGIDGVISYIDDFLIYGESKEQHDDRL